MPSDGRGGEQLVDEGILGASQRRQRHRRLGQEVGRVDRAAVRGGHDHRHGLARRQAAIEGLVIGAAGKNS